MADEVVDTVAAVAVVDTPVVDETVAPVEEEENDETSVTPEVRPPMSKKEAWEALRAERAEKAAAAKTEPAKPVEAAKPADPAKPDAAAKPVVGAIDKVPGDAKAPEPVKTEGIRIPIDANHPVRGMGKDAITVATPQEERVVRALLNGTYQRRQDVEERDTQIRQLRQELARRDSATSAQAKWQGTPSYKAAADEFTKLRELEEDGTLPDGAAERYWRGVQMDLQRIEQEEYAGREAAMQAEEDDRAAADWTRETFDALHHVPQPIRELPDFKRYFDEAMQSFNAEINLGRYEKLRPLPQTERLAALQKEFYSFFGSRLVREKAVQDTYRTIKDNEQRQSAAQKAALAQREKEAIELRAVEKAKRDAATRRTQAPPHPLGNLHTSSRDQTPEGTAGADDLSGMSAHEVRKRARAGAREDARARSIRRP